MRSYPCLFGSEFSAPVALIVIGSYSRGVYFEGEGGVYLLAAGCGSLSFAAETELDALPYCEEGSVWQYGNGTLSCGQVCFSGGHFPKDGLKRRKELFLPALEKLVKREGRGALFEMYTGVSSPLSDLFSVCAEGIREGLLGGDLKGAVEHTVGLGRGLTPDGDDFLAGLLYAFRERGRKELFAKLSAEVVRAAERTTKISAEYLLCAARGGEFSRLTDVLRLPGSEEAAERLLGIGHSSGSSAAVGILTGLSWLREAV